MKKILVTGANGFLGSNISEYFAMEGYNVRGWGLYERVDTNYIVSRVDMTDIVAIEKELVFFKPDIIIHCAGSANVNLSVSSPLVDFNGNVMLTHNLMFSLKKVNLLDTKVLFLSSAAVYGNPIDLPINEDTVLNPMSPYAMHKLMCENICQYFSSNHSMDIKILRIFSAFGVGLKKQIFWDMFQKAKKNNSLEMFGTGLESRDFINVKDVVNVIHLIINNASKSEIIFNVANGTEIPILRATETFADYYGISSDSIKFSGHVREGEPIRWQADITKIKKLGYTPSISFESGIQEYVNWVTNIANDWRSLRD